MTDAEEVRATDQRQTQQRWLLFNFREEFRIRHLHVFESGIEPRFAFAIHDPSERKAISETPDFARRHWLLFQVDKMNRNSALFEEAVGCARGWRVLQPKDLDGRQEDKNGGRAGIRTPDPLGVNEVL